MRSLAQNTYLQNGNQQTGILANIQDWCRYQSLPAVLITFDQVPLGAACSGNDQGTLIELRVLRGRDAGSWRREGLRA